MKIKSLSAIFTTATLAVMLSACGSNANTEAKLVEVPTPKVIAAEPSFTKTDSVVGTGATAEAGQTVSVHYTGWLYDASAPENRGKKFDSSLDRGQPFEFPLGGGRVIKGWDEGVAGMKIGGKRTLIIPSEMGYGERSAGPIIKPGSTLLFDVELLGIK